MESEGCGCISVGCLTLILSAVCLMGTIGGLWFLFSKLTGG
jgi:hypothetical protein